MSQTVVTANVLKQNNYSVIAGDLALTMSAIDTVNGNAYQATGREVLVFQNTDSATHTITITSVADSLGRTDASLTNYSLAVSPGLSAIQMKFVPGWQQSNGQIYIAGSSNLVKFAVLQTN